MERGLMRLSAHMGTSLRTLLLCLAGPGVLGCSVDPPEAADAPPAGQPAVDVEPPPATPADPPPAPLTFAWGSCRLTDPQGGRHAADCSFVDVPLHHEAPERGTTRIAVYRLPAPSGNARAQLWMLAGGPGSPGTNLAYYADAARGAMGPDADIYLVDHRGTGESTYLDCPVASQRPGSTSMSSYLKRCSEEVRAAHGETLDGFTTTQVAHDVRRLIDSTATPEQKVFVYGGSYGSYLAHRLLQLEGVRVDGVVTDGNCLSSTCGLDVPQDLYVDDVVREVMDVCKGDATCRAKLGDDPWGFVVATMKRVAEGHCAAASLATMNGADWAHPVGVVWPAGLAPAIYRLARCNDADVAALNQLVRIATGETGFDGVPTAPRPLDDVPAPSSTRGRSVALYYHVATSEMVASPPPSYESLRALAEGRVFQPDRRRLQLGFVESWQTYPRDGFVGGFATRDVPWLMLQGTFDFQAMESKAAEGRAKIVDPKLAYVKVRGAGHGVAFATACGRELVTKFVADPTKPLDLGCVADVQAKALALDPAWVNYYLGTADPWD